MDELSFQFLSIFIAMVIPLLFIVFMLDDKKSRQIILFFCWGIFAGILSFNLNNLFGGNTEQAQRMTVSIAPIIEEICKGLPVLLLVLIRKQPQQSIRLIVLCALASGVGFSIQESIYYFATSSREVMDIWLLVIRTMTTSPMHGITTAAFGIGLMISYKQKHVLVPLVFGLLALCASVHALFNMLLQTEFALIAMIMPIGIFLIGRSVLARVEH